MAEVYGIEMMDLPEGLHPLECIVLIKGILMETGTPTMTALGSEGMLPWEAAGMLQMEAQRLTMEYGASMFFDDDEEDEGESV